ncbi:Gfo/Idh/MocA family oxidoreductase [Gordonia sinesedis]
MRIGVLGASRIAESAIVGPAAELGHRLVVVAARDRDRAVAFAEKFGVERVADGYADVIADPEVDVIYNPLANALHAPWNLAAIRAGKPVLTEKPFARNAAEAIEVADAARAAGVLVLEGFHYLFHPLMTRTFALLDAGAIGLLRHVEVVMAMPEPAASDPRWFYDLAGGSLMDLGCYGLHVFRMLSRYGGGAPVVTGASAIVRGDDGRIDESSLVEVAYPGGATGRNTNSMVADGFTFSCRITGEHGALFLHDFLSPLRDNRLSITVDGHTTVEELPARSTYSYQLDAFAGAVLDGADLPIGLDDAVDTMRYVDDAYTAAGLPPR